VPVHCATAWQRKMMLSAPLLGRKSGSGESVEGGKGWWAPSEGGHHSTVWETEVTTRLGRERESEGSAS
jgi:hypothetical protein